MSYNIYNDRIQGGRLSMRFITAEELVNELLQSGIYDAEGRITMELNGTSVEIKENDTVGNILQEWLGQWLKDNDIYFRPPEGQSFPDFYLQESNEVGLCEMKAYCAKRTPAFDIANFDSYWKSIELNPRRLDSDYIIFAYSSNDGIIKIEKIFLKKVWEITSATKDFPLKCQRKNGQIYNIRPCSFNSKRTKVPAFSSKEEFLAALYRTVLSHTNKATETRIWLNNVIKKYKNDTGYELIINI